MKRINIICSDVGWIYSTFIKEFRKYSEHSIFLNAKSNYDIIYSLPYYEMPKTKHINKPITAWFSHQEQKTPLKEKFISSGKAVDFAFSQSKKYADLLKDNGVKNVVQIMPGVDLEKFWFKTKPAPNRKKLVVGYIGRQYTSSNRKNPRLLDKISKLPFIDFKTTGGSIDPNRIPAFYDSLDLIVSPALIEGGAMCITEGLSMGKPVLCYESVGVADEFDFGVIKVPYNNEQAFLNRIENFFKGREYIGWYEETQRLKARDQVKHLTWKNFVKTHDEVWNKL